MTHQCCKSQSNVKKSHSSKAFLRFSILCRNLNNTNHTSLSMILCFAYMSSQVKTLISPAEGTMLETSLTRKGSIWHDLPTTRPKVWLWIMLLLVSIGSKSLFLQFLFLGSQLCVLTLCLKQLGAFAYLPIIPLLAFSFILIPNLSQWMLYHYAGFPDILDTQMSTTALFLTLTQPPALSEGLPKDSL